jgi:predicted phosphoribosyltransferase
MPDRLFRDRRDAGQFLAGLLEEYRGRPDVVVLGLPRGGVPAAYEVATALGAPLDVAPEAIQHAAEREGRELVRREQAYREGRSFPPVAGKVVIVVDDGLATGSRARKS